jgi:hypothetical protein
LLARTGRIQHEVARYKLLKTEFRYYRPEKKGVKRRGGKRVRSMLRALDKLVNREERH